MIREWRVMIARTVDGVVLEDVRPSEYPSFSRAINKAGSWGVSVKLDDPSNEHVDFRAYVSSKYTWIVCYGDFVVQAGPVTSYGVDGLARSLEVGGPGIGGLFENRIMRNANGHTAIVHPSEDITYADKTLGELIRDMIAMNMAQPGFALPIDLPPTGATGTLSGTYHAYELKTVWDLIGEFTDQGIEFEFAPYLTPTGSHVRWELKVGDPLLGDQLTPAVWDSNGALTGIAIDGDASAATTTRVWVKGSGSERALLTGFENAPELHDQDYPGMDYVDGEHTSVSDQPTLERYADEALAAFRYPVETWDTEVRINGCSPANPSLKISPGLGDWSLGDAPQFAIINHPWIPSGTYRRRILGYGSSSQDRVKLTLQEGDPV